MIPAGANLRPISRADSTCSGVIWGFAFMACVMLRSISTSMTGRAAVRVPKNSTTMRTQKTKKEDLLALLRTEFGAIRQAEWLVALDDKSYQLSPLGELKINDRAAVGIKIA